MVQSLSNGNGTYTTITTYSQTNITPTGGNHGGYTPPTTGGTGDPGCPSPYVLVNGQCTTIATPPSCPSPYTYTNGQCTPPPTPPKCPDGYTLSNGKCYPAPNCHTTTTGWWIFTNTSTQCDPPPFTCPTGQNLVNGQCVPPPPPSCRTGFVLNNGVCIPSPQVSSCTPLTVSQNGGYCPAGSYPYLNDCYPSNQCQTGSTNHNFNMVTCYGVPILNCPAGINAAPTVSITAKPNLVRSGESTHLTWDGGNATECAITGTDGFSSSRISDNTTISDVTERRTYTITCDAGGPSASASTTVNILPVWQEI